MTNTDSENTLHLNRRFVWVADVKHGCFDFYPLRGGCFHRRGPHFRLLRPGHRRSAGKSWSTAAIPWDGNEKNGEQVNSNSERERESLKLMARPLGF